MILVTGASGTIGSEVLRRLAGTGEVVRAMTRDASRVRTSPGIDIVHGDFEDPASLAQAVAEATTVFLLAAPGSWIARHDLAMLDAARAAGVRKVVKLSAIGTDAMDHLNEGRHSPAGWHLPGEQAVQASGMAWTLLRPSGFASNALRWADAIRAGDPVPNMTGTGTLGIIDPRDVAAIAVEALISSKHEGQTYTLTGPELLSVPDQAARLEEVLGYPVKTVDVPLDVAREQMLAAGMDSSVVDVAIDGRKFVRAGGGATLTDDVERALGRAPTTFEAWARDHRDAFAN
jgi:uncharacterized protein YbjT (DUF2867 family)